MLPLAEFQERLAAVGDLCSRAQGERILALTLRALSASGSRTAAASIRATLPSWLQPSWDAALASAPPPASDDLVSCVAREGDYAYRAAAERHVKAVLACLRENMDEHQIWTLEDLLPPRARALFGSAAACVYDASAGQFL